MKAIFVLMLFVAIYFQISAQKGERDANYHFKSENYPVALKLYQDIYKSDTADMDLNYRLGVCYLNCNKNPKAALKHLLYVEGEKAKDEIYYYELGKAYLYNYKFDGAKDAFTKSKNLSVKNVEFTQLVDTWMAMTENARKFTRKPMDVSFINLGKYINNEMDELTPVITADGETLLYGSNNKFDRGFNLYTHDIYFSKLSDNDFKKGKPFTAANTMDDEFIAGISATGDKVFVQLQGYDAFEDLAECVSNGKRYDKKELLMGEVNSKSTEHGATASITGDTLFFSSSRPDGKGGMDIYFCKHLPNGEWGIPTLLSDKINTQYDEDYPIMAPDGKTMYFCSNGTKSMGGFDVFKTTLLPNGEFTEPKNIGFPLNDVFDNMTIAFSPNQRYAYVSAIRSDSYGYADLYRVVFNQKDPSVKLYILKMKTGTKENRTDYGAADTTLNITAFKKGKVVFGKYAYYSKNSQATLALPPGVYNIEIKGKATETKNIKLTIDDAPGTDKIIKQTVVLEPKN